MKLLDRALESCKYDLLNKKNVLGVGIGYKNQHNKRTGKIGIITLVTEKKSLGLLDPYDVIPSQVNGFITDVWETGPVRTFQTRRGVLRPALPGCSIGHVDFPGVGTLGAIVRNIKGEKLILSNNHILANLTNGRDGRSKVGDDIVQPGRYDGGTKMDKIALLKSFISLNYGNNEENPQLVDAALAQPNNSNLIGDQVLNIGLITGTTDAQLGQAVFKSGRSTGLTRGSIIAMKVLLKISYADQLSVEVIFDDQILADTLSMPGDSGSLLVTTEERKATGLLVGGGAGIDVYNRISNVIDQLNITF